jgi:hypothetical protein
MQLTRVLAGGIGRRHLLRRRSLRWSRLTDYGAYVPAGMLTTVAPAGGRKVEAGGLGVYAVRVTVTPLVFVWVRIPLEFAAQKVTGVGWARVLAVT